MNITITSRKFKAREELKQFITDEIQTLSRFHDDILDAEVILSFQNPKDSIKEVELIVKVPGHVLKATEGSEEFEKSTRAVAEKMIRQLKKIKDKN